MTLDLRSSQWRVIFSVIILLFFARLVLSAITGLVDDEAYYRIWSLAPALSYYDHPPMVAYLIALGRWLVGDTTLGVRLAGPFMHAVGAIVLIRTAFLFFGEKVAQVSVWFYLAMPLLAAGGMIITPDGPSVFFTGLTLWTLAELSKDKNYNWLLLTGIFAGCGILSKYTNLFVGVTILLWLIAVPENRKIFKQLQLWVSGVIAAVVASPVLIWNMQNEWASFGKQLGRVNSSNALLPKQEFSSDAIADMIRLNQMSTGPVAPDPITPFYFLEFIGSYIGLAGGLIALLSVIGLYKITKEAIAKGWNSSLLIPAAVLPLFLYFTVHSVTGRVQANWLAPAYPALAMAAGYAACILQDGRLKNFLNPRVATIIGFVMIALFHVQSLGPLISFKNDPTKQMRGWDTVSATVENQLKETGATWIVSSSFATNAQLAFAFRNRVPVHQLNERIRYRHLPSIPEDLTQKPALYIELDRRVHLAWLNQLFHDVREIEPVIKNNNEKSPAKYRVFYVSGPRDGALKLRQLRFSQLD
jgi:4-amino-4-deoxy-L-arabinose transferase-like glycosyltransferase